MAELPLPADFRRQMADVIGDAVSRAAGLRDTLERERQALTLQNTEELQAVVIEKDGRVTQLRELDERRRALCADNGFDAGPDPMQEAIAWCDEDDVLANGWRQLMDIAAECNALNLTNGAIIRGQLHFVETGLAVLRGGENSPALYGRDGATRTSAATRSIGAA